MPLGVQGAAMVVDELYFHRRRGLGACERIGHPLDTMTVFACIAWALWVPPDARAITVYVGAGECQARGDLALLKRAATCDRGYM